ncbi:DUF3348 family protein [Rubrivivax sp. A210]|uniref:DUF3348 family protein n=1 Tax=Rubrivivax sp. A210 TaxID=2772301 RepID=UPI001F40ECBB|nr:DUF3348 family protein [Rubrivivax sp. A210]
MRAAGFNSSALVRLLAALAAPELAGEAKGEPSLAESLGRWLDWTGAISLSAALSVGAVAEAPGATAAAKAAAAECLRARAQLAKAIAAEPVFASEPVAGAADFLPYRHAVMAQQRAMETRIAALRSQVRRALAGRGGALAQLAALDGAMDEALAARERALLAGVPALLEKRFARLQRETDDPAGTAWRAAIGQELKSVLLAELELRLQPVLGLLEALEQEDMKQPARA